MLSKSRGQILRVAAVMHVLFHFETPLNIPHIISEDALKAAQNFVDVCNQYAAYLAGRGEISTAIEAINTIEKGTRTHTHTYSYTYRIARNIGGELNLADWRFASRPPN